MIDTTEPTLERIKQAAASHSPHEALLAIAIELRDQGLGQEKLYELFSAALTCHRQDQDEGTWDAIADTMDRICGFCVPSSRLFPDTSHKGTHQ